MHDCKMPPLLLPGVRLNEVVAINHSLSSLRNVISRLVASKGEHIPYRDHQLTMLLKVCDSYVVVMLPFLFLTPAKLQ